MQEGAGLLEVSKHAIRMPVSLLCVFLAALSCIGVDLVGELGLTCQPFVQ